MEGEGLTKGKTGGADSSSSVGKMMRPHKTIKKGNTHAKPFMTGELWKACELVTGQALSPKRGDFSDINEYNICCHEWRARESQLMLGDRSKDQLLPRDNQDGETRRNLDSHLFAAANGQTLPTPSLQADACADSRLTGAYKPVRSPSLSEAGKQGNSVGSGLQEKSLAAGENEGLVMEWTDESRDNGRCQKGQSEVRGSFDLNNTIHSRLGERFSNDLGFSNGAQASDSGMAGLLEGVAQNSQLLSHMIPAVREWLRGQGLKVHLPSSPLGPRLSKKTMSRRNGPEGYRPSREEPGNAADQRGVIEAIRQETATPPNIVV